MRISSRGAYNQRLQRINRNKTRRTTPKRKGHPIYFFITVLVIVICFYLFYGSNNNSQGNSQFSLLVPTASPTPTIETFDLNLQIGETSQIDIEDGFQLEQSSILENDKTFYRFINKTLTITPKKTEINKSQKIEFSNDKGDKLIYNLTVKQKELDFLQLENKIGEILGKDAQKYGIYIKDLKRDKVIKVNADQVYPPASISKVPIAIIALKDIQKGKYALNSTFPMKQGYKVYDFDSMTYIPNGTAVTLDRYISTMLIESDNTAMTGLESIFGGVNSLNNRFKNELGIDTFFRMPHDSKAQDIGLVFENIYSGKYLDEERNAYLLEKLSNTAERFQDRIQAGVPNKSGVKVAHKIGQVTTEFGASYNDAGIVYGEKTDFVIVVINQSISEAAARQKIVDLTEVTYEFLNQ